MPTSIKVMDRNRQLLGYIIKRGSQYEAYVNKKRMGKAYSTEELLRKYFDKLKPQT